MVLEESSTIIISSSSPPPPPPPPPPFSLVFVFFFLFFSFFVLLCSSSDVPARPAATRVGSALQLADSQVTFRDVPVGRKTHRGLRLENMTSRTYSWLLRRADQDAAASEFSFGRLSGVLGPQAVTVLDAYYEPHWPGHHSQRWNLEYESNAVLPTDDDVGVLGLQLHGHTDVQPAGTAVTAAVTAAAVGDGAGGQQAIFLEPARLDYSPTEPGETLQLSVSVCNETDQVLPVDFAVADAGVFAVNHRHVDLQPRSYVQLPVRFSPRAPGTFSGTLLVSNRGHTLRVPLTGSCARK